MTPVTAPVTGLSLPLSFRPSPSRAGRRGRCCPPGHEHGSVGRFRQVTPPRSPRLITEQDTFLLLENPSCPVPGDPHAPQGQPTLSHLQIRLLVRDLPAGGRDRRGCSGVWLLPLVPTSAAASGHVVPHLRNSPLFSCWVVLREKHLLLKTSSQSRFGQASPGDSEAGQ